MKYTRSLAGALAGLLVLGLAACASDPAREDRDVFRYLLEVNIPGSSAVNVESSDDVFKLDAEAKSAIDQRILTFRDHHARRRALLEEIVRHASSNFSYSGGANTTASETFHRQSANCLSLSILAYAIALHAGYDARFQEVKVPDYWERRDRFSVMSRHINVRIGDKPSSGTMAVIRKVELEVDFMPIPGIVNPPKQVIPIKRVLAMYYNNKAVDAMIAGNHARAHAYLKAALEEDPSLDMAFGNLALLYANLGDFERAETGFRQAHALNPGNFTVADNLAILLAKEGRSNEAAVIRARVDRHRRNDPWFQFILGEEAFDAGDDEAAAHFYQRAIALKPDEDGFHYALARLHIKRGNIEHAERSLRRAERHADYEELKEKYRSLRVNLVP